MTSIEWVKNPDNQTQGITVNSKTGCRNHDNGLCKGGGFPCYAYKLAHGRLKSIYSRSIIGGAPSSDPFYPRFWADRLEGIRKIHKPTGIFLDDMSDWMGEYWPKEWTEMELQVMRDCPQHRFYTLTKQAQQLPQWSPFPENCWVGVTATNEKMFHSGIQSLKSIEATVRFISVEPLLSWNTPFDYLVWEALWRAHINLLIIGACTGTASTIGKLIRRYPALEHKPLGNLWTAQPSIEWVREIVEAADKAGLKVFLKNNLSPLIHSDALSGQYALDTGLLTWDGELRQEMPK